MNAITAECHEAKRDQTLGEELANSISHGLGLLAAAIGAPVLLAAAWQTGDPFFLTGTAIFAGAMLLVYLGSALYHACPRGMLKSFLRVVDHSAIFILIAGTYTPFALGPLRGGWGWTILALIWSLALFGVLLKTLSGAERRPRLSLALYLGMGWLVVLAARPLLLRVPLGALGWLLGGGLAYTAGVFFFISKRHRYTHFIWHLFALLGTTCHFLAVFSCTA